MKRTMRIIALLALILVVLTACGNKEPKTTDQATPSGAAAGQPAAPSESSAKSTPTAMAAKATSQAAEEALPTGKGILTSFVQTMEIKEEILKPEKATKDWLSVETRVQTEPAPGANSVTMTDKSGGQGENDLKMISIGGFSYMYDSGSKKWMKFAQDESSMASGMTSMLFTATDLGSQADGGLFDASRVVSRKETIDGVSTTHYRIEGEQFLKLQGGFSLTDWNVVSGQADYWIANKGDYVKQYEADYIVNDSDGQQLREYIKLTVTNENQPVDIQAPPDDQVEDLTGLSSMIGETETPAPGDEADDETQDTVDTAEEVEAATSAALLDGLPEPPNSEKVDLSGLSGEMAQLAQIMGAGGPNRIFLSSATMDEIQQFYKEELEARGYSSVMSPAGQGNAQISMFGSDEGMVELILQTDAETGKIMVLVMALK